MTSDNESKQIGAHPNTVPFKIPNKQFKQMGAICLILQDSHPGHRTIVILLNYTSHSSTIYSELFSIKEETVAIVDSCLGWC